MRTRMVTGVHKLVIRVLRAHVSHGASVWVWNMEWGPCAVHGCVSECLTLLRFMCRAVSDQGLLETGDLVVVVSDIISHDDVTAAVRSIQLRHIS